MITDRCCDFHSTGGDPALSCGGDNGAVYLRQYNEAQLVDYIFCLLAEKPLTPVGNMLLCSIEDELQRRKQEEQC